MIILCLTKISISVISKKNHTNCSIVWNNRNENRLSHRWNKSSAIHRAIPKHYKIRLILRSTKTSISVISKKTLFDRLKLQKPKSSAILRCERSRLCASSCGAGTPALSAGGWLRRRRNTPVFARRSKSRGQIVCVDLLTNHLGGS